MIIKNSKKMLENRIFLLLDDEVYLYKFSRQKYISKEN